MMYLLPIQWSTDFKSLGRNSLSGSGDGVHSDDRSRRICNRIRVPEVLLPRARRTGRIEIVAHNDEIGLVCDDHRLVGRTGIQLIRDRRWWTRYIAEVEDLRYGCSIGYVLKSVHVPREIRLGG